MLTHKGTQTLHTSRLTLRPFTMDDAQAMYDNWASDPEVTKFLTWPTHTSVAVTEMVLKEWVGSYDKPDYYQWAIEYEGAPVGSISVVSHSERIEKAMVGYCIGRRWWHRGITSEALQAVIDFLFREVGMQRVEAYHDANNPNSGAVMRKCGMTYEGTHRNSDWNNQGVCDAVWYAILREEWGK